MNLDQLTTPALVLDRRLLAANSRRMAAHLGRFGVPLRPHVKTVKSAAALEAAFGGLPKAITVSTLAEAEYFFAAGIADILYAVGIAPAKLDAVARLMAAGADMKIILDSAEAAQMTAERGRALGVRFPALIEIDCDGHRAGLKPGDPAIVAVGRLLAGDAGTALAGVLTHAGASYDCRSDAALVAMAEQERAAVATAAAALRGAGLACPIVSMGSTPTALFARNLDGVTEVRAGVYLLQDLVMAGIGVCRPEDIALSVLTTVIGHNRDKGWIVTDGGWMALSRDRGTAAQPVDQGYGLVADRAGRILPGLRVEAANQEHGILAARAGATLDPDRFPIGTRLRILPNHACATGAQHRHYHVVDRGEAVVAVWERMGGW
jgi:D-serine deaminase-like pyridoxal phosphate-dependent protein